MIEREEPEHSSRENATTATPPSYWLTRFAILRLLGFVYFIAFLSLAQQVLPLIGHDGLLPADSFLMQVASHFGSRSAAFLRLPSVFWLGVSDTSLVVCAWCGTALSLAVCLGYANSLMMLTLWGLYMSYVHIGQDWFSYGWDIQILETGFLGVFLCPLLDGRPFPRRSPPVAVLWLMRWLTFRIMLGAGLIKMRGDPCWRDLTCLYYHYETQPLPGPLSRALHFAPHWSQKLGVLWNHVIELAVPWFALGPRAARHVAGVLLASFQVILILSGNLSFLNWLTIVPILACFDDSFFAKIVPRRLSMAASSAAEIAEPSRVQDISAILLAVTVGLLSVMPTLNLFSGSQLMNASFDPIHLVNTYGAFGSVGKERDEIIFEGTRDEEVTSRTQWKEYEFKCKPGDPFRRPPFVTPYHCRLDWQIWFAAMSTFQEYPWTLHFVWKLLHNDAGVLGLLAGNPFPGSPPRFIRAELYRYQFAKPGNTEGAWWKRERIGEWLPALSADDEGFKQFLSANGWDAGR